MTDDEKHLYGQIQVWVWSGFYDTDEAEQHLDGLYEDDPEIGLDIEVVRKSLSAEFAKKAVAEKSWPKETDCDRLDRVFDALDAAGIVALQNAGYTMSDGRSEALHERGFDKYHGYCFYHGQDLERAVRGGGLMLAFGDIDADPAKKTAVGHEICASLARAGFNPIWNGDPERRIEFAIDWKRRRTR